MLGALNTAGIPWMSVTARPRPVRRLLGQNPTLRQIAQAVGAREKLLAEVRDRLPADMAPHCLFAQHRGDLLVLYVDSPAWATRLRFQAPQLLGAVGGAYQKKAQVAVRLLVQGTGRRPSGDVRKRSPAAASTVTEAAAGIDDRELQSALLRLGRRLGGR